MRHMFHAWSNGAILLVATVRREDNFLFEHGKEPCGSPFSSVVGLSVVSQTLCKIVVFPEFALPMMRTRKLIFGIGRDCFVSIRIDWSQEIDFTAQVHTLIKLYVKIIQTPSRSCFLPRGAGRREDWSIIVAILLQIVT